MYCDDVADAKGSGIWNGCLFFQLKLHELRFYSIIYLANMLEENRHRFQNVSEERINYWIAQANFFKGLMYFELARRWGEAPIAPATEDASAQAKSPVDTVLAYALRAAEAALVLPKYDQLTDASGAAVTSRQFVASVPSARYLPISTHGWAACTGTINTGKSRRTGLSRDRWQSGCLLAREHERSRGKTLGSARDVTEVIHTIEMNGQDDDRYYQGSFWNSYPGFAFV
ncbi:MAG: RagB/SusD family nutrient uptake outer membrane protein [Butyricimonas faecihominis]